MSEVKAIETRYKGYRFRSRLEARWAVFFDSLGLVWQYEPEGFLLADGTKYLPDFYLPSLDLWVEVKPENSTGEDAQKACKFAFFNNNRVWLAKGLPSAFEGKFLYAYRDEEIGEAFFDWGLEPLVHKGLIPYELYATSQRFTGLIGLTEKDGQLRPTIKEGTSETEMEEIQRFASAASPWIVAHTDSFHCDLGVIGFVLDTDELGVKGLRYAPFQDPEYAPPAIIRDAFTSAKSARFEFGEQGAG